MTAEPRSPEAGANEIAAAGRARRGRAYRTDVGQDPLGAHGARCGHDAGPPDAACALNGREDLVFAGQGGDHLDASALYRRYKLALRRAGLRDLRFHDLSHTFGTQVIANVAPDDDLSPTSTGTGSGRQRRAGRRRSGPPIGRRGRARLGDRGGDRSLTDLAGFPPQRHAQARTAGPPLGGNVRIPRDEPCDCGRGRQEPHLRVVARGVGGLGTVLRPVETSARGRWAPALNLTGVSTPRTAHVKRLRCVAANGPREPPSVATRAERKLSLIDLTPPSVPWARVESRRERSRTVGF
jgi:hypothetical protein